MKRKANLYVSTASIEGDRRLAVILKRFYRLGLFNVEISAPHPYLPIEEIEDLLIAYKKKGMNFLIHNYFPTPKNRFVMNITSNNDRIRKPSEILIYNAITLSRKLGTNLYSIHAGYLRDATENAYGMFEFKDNYKSNFAECLEILNRGLRQLFNRLSLDSADETFFIALENLFPTKEENNSICCTMDEISEVMDVLWDLNVGLLVDLGHLAIASNILQFDRYDFIEEIISKFGDRIYEVHLSENDGYHDLHEKLDVKSWQLDVLKRFKECGLEIKEGVKFTIESRRLVEQDLIETYEKVSNYI